MTNETTVTKTETAAAAPKAPRVVKHIDERIKEAREAVTKAQARLQELETEAANRDKLESVTKGQRVNFRFGRADKARVLTGEVTAVGVDDKGNRLVAVSVGEGLDMEVMKIPATSIIFDGETA